MESINRKEPPGQFKTFRAADPVVSAEEVGPPVGVDIGLDEPALPACSVEGIKILICLKWTPLSRPFSAGNKLMFDGPVL